MAIYRRVEEVEAVQWTGENLDECKELLGNAYEYAATSDLFGNHIKISTHKGICLLSEWIVKEYGSINIVNDKEFKESYDDTAQELQTGGKESVFPMSLEDLGIMCIGLIIGFAIILYCLS